MLPWLPTGLWSPPLHRHEVKHLRFGTVFDPQTVISLGGSALGVTDDAIYDHFMPPAGRDLGRAQWFAGNREGARSTWGEGQKAHKFNPWAKRCQEMLDLVAAGGEVPRSLPS